MVVIFPNRGLELRQMWGKEYKIKRDEISGDLQLLCVIAIGVLSDKEWHFCKMYALSLSGRKLV